MVDPRLMRKFDTGYKVGEALTNAEKWWAEYRGSIPRALNLRTDEKVRTGPGVPMIRSITTERDDVPSGILSGKPWAELNEVEQAYVTKVWHHYHIRVPRRQTDAKTKQVLNVECDNPNHPEEIPKTATFEAMNQRSVARLARSEGWDITPGYDLCPWCHQAKQLALAEPAGTA